MPYLPARPGRNRRWGIVIIVVTDIVVLIVVDAIMTLAGAATIAIVPPSLSAWVQVETTFATPSPSKAK